MATLATRRTLDRQLKRLLNDILVLGSMVEQAVIQAVEALRKRDLALARRIYTSDVRVNEKRYQIEQEGLVLLATQQPIACDLRILASIMEVNTELERMGDYAKGIARITMEISRQLPVKYPEELSKMAACSTAMLHQALSAFVEFDEAAAYAIPDMDEEVDAYYNLINRSLIEMVGQNPALINSTNYLMWAAHNLERMADRVTNICERTIFMATGKLIELDLPDNSDDFN